MSFQFVHRYRIICGLSRAQNNTSVLNHILSKSRLGLVLFLQMMYSSVNVRNLEDGGKRLRERITKLEKEVMMTELKENISKSLSPDEVIVGE